ncbi:MAG: hypothetical protein KDK70_25840, partial [Myxococcales bacterium]|nr:hypothetical protein [Myxococcales bacterium]
MTHHRAATCPPLLHPALLVLTGATALLLAAPSARAELLVSEFGVGTVVDVEAGGDFTNAPRFATGLSGPFGMCVGPGGDVYVAEFLSGEVTIITAGGDFTATAPFASGLLNPVELHCSPTEVWVTEFEFGPSDVTDITAGGDFTGAPAYATGLQQVVGILRDAGGTLWVSRQDLGQIIDVTAGGDLSMAAPYATGGNLTRGLTQRGASLYAADTGTQTVLDWTAGGNMSLNVFAQVSGVVNVVNTDLGLMALSESQGALYDITAGGDFTVAVPFASGIQATGGYGGILSTTVCGNGVIESGEACDDAGESAACDADCTLASCGDGTLNATAGETCDDMGESATCDDDCTAVMCGDGVLNTTAAEACDDGGESATCNADCTEAMCGDGLVNNTA